MTAGNQYHTRTASVGCPKGCASDCFSWWKKPKYKGERKMSVITLKQLLEAGVHFGHFTRRWNPKMAEYIFTERNGIYIIDLQKSVAKLEEAYNALLEVENINTVSLRPPEERCKARRSLQLRKGNLRKRRNTPLRRHEEAGCGRYQRRSRALRNVLCKHTLARRYAHKL